MKYSHDISNFLEEISVFPILLFSSVSLLDHLERRFYLSLLFFGTLLSDGYNFPFPFVRPPQIVILLFAFLFLGMVLITTSCIMLWTSIHSSSGTLSDLIPWIYFSLPLYSHKGFDLGHTWPKSSGFPFFLQFKSELCNKEFMIWVTVSLWSCLCWLYRASPSSTAKNIINMISVLTIWWCPCVESSLVLLEEGVCYDQCILLAKVLAFALLHLVLQGQTCLLLQVSLDFLLLHSSPLWWNGCLFLLLVH